MEQGNTCFIFLLRLKASEVYAQEYHLVHHRDSVHIYLQVQVLLDCLCTQGEGGVRLNWLILTLVFRQALRGRPKEEILIS